MKRLTRRDEFGNADINNVDMTFMLGLKFDDMVLLTEAFNKLADYEDADVNQWIPCSERSPDKFGKYLVNVGQPYLIPRYRWTDIAFFVDGRWYDVQEGTKVFAWMPLPQPYRGDD